MDEENIFGPLTLRQFIYSAGGALVIYFAYEYLALKVSLPIIVVAAIVIVTGFIQHQAVVIDENYIRNKRNESESLQKFQRWLNLKIATIKSQISIRESRGLVSDPELEKALKMFETAMRDIK
jgi:hypothetical protein